MRFQVSCAHPATGREFVKVVEADSPEEARGKVTRGMLVSGVRKLPSHGSLAIDVDDGPVAVSELREATVRCTNCANAIGGLERPCEWRGERVCERCYRKLAADDGVGLGEPAGAPETLAAAVLEYRGARTGAPSAASASVPEYKDIVNGAGVLRQIGNVLVLAGILAILGGVGVAMFIVAAVPRGDVAVASEGTGLAVAAILTGVLWGIIFFVAAVLVRLAASCSLALRDIARNSFGR